MSAAVHLFDHTSIDCLHDAFLFLLPKIQTHAQIYFRDTCCADTRADCVAETIGLAWKWFVCLRQRGKDPSRFVSTLASLAARNVRSGRRVCGMERVQDVLSSRAQRRHGFRVERLPASTRAFYEELYGAPHAQEAQDDYEERLRDNTITPPPDAAAFRIDFRAWLQTLTGRERRLISAMALNERTKDLSRTFEVSPGRISQFRRAFHDDWTRFCSDPADSVPATSV